jgi:cyanophycinase
MTRFHVLPFVVAAIGCAGVSRASRFTSAPATIAAASTVAPAPAAPAAAAPARGYLLIVGGGPQPPELVQRFVDLAGGAGHAKIVVFAMASEDGKESGEEKADDLRKLGAQAVNLYITREQANSDSVAHLLDGVTGIWFGGGDQVRLTHALQGTKVEAAIHERYRAGAVVGGTSAGAAVMTTPMITGNERHPGGARPPSDSSSNFMTIARDNIETASGFGLLPGVIVDQHFLRRKRHNRLVSVVLEHPSLVGIGIDESTALLVEPDGRWRILGASAAVIYDARHAAITPAGAPVLGATNITMHVLPAGSSYDPRTGRATLPGGGEHSAARRAGAPGS